MLSGVGASLVSTLAPVVPAQAGTSHPVPFLEETFAQSRGGGSFSLGNTAHSRSPAPISPLKPAFRVSGATAHNRSFAAHSCASPLVPARPLLTGFAGCPALAWPRTSCCRNQRTRSRRDRERGGCQQFRQPSPPPLSQWARPTSGLSRGFRVPWLCEERFGGSPPNCSPVRVRDGLHAPLTVRTGCRTALRKASHPNRKGVPQCLVRRSAS